MAKISYNGIKAGGMTPANSNAAYGKMMNAAIKGGKSLGVGVGGEGKMKKSFGNMPKKTKGKVLKKMMKNYSK